MARRGEPIGWHFLATLIALPLTAIRALGTLAVWGLVGACVSGLIVSAIAWGLEAAFSMHLPPWTGFAGFWVGGASMILVCLWAAYHGNDRLDNAVFWGVLLLIPFAWGLFLVNAIAPKLVLPGILLWLLWATWITWRYQVKGRRVK